MSRAFTQGRPLLFENAFGNDAALHNWYSIPLFYPLTAWLGARGLFLGFFALCLLALVAVDRLRRGDPERASAYGAVAVTVFLGPIAFWLADDLPYGFNLELVFLPLAVLFAAGLVRRSRTTVLWGLLLFLTREDGPVLAWSIHALAVWTRSAEPSGRKRALFRLTLFWLALFALELAWLRHMTPPDQPSRVGAALSALARVTRTPHAAEALASAFFDVGILLAAGVLVACYFVPSRVLLAGAVVSLPLLATLVVASQPYAGVGILERGPSWAPRFALVWGLFAAVCLLGIAASPPTRRRERQGVVAAAVVVGLLAQYGALRWRRSYAVDDRLSFTRLTKGEGSFSSRLTLRERVFLDCLAHRLPPETVVRTNHPLFAIFERQDVVWPDHPAENTWTGGYAQVTLCDVAGRTYSDGCVDWIRQLPADGFVLAQVDGLEVAYGRAVAGAVEECGAGTRK
jgi:hypothetical protein